LSIYTPFHGFILCCQFQSSDLNWFLQPDTTTLPQCCMSPLVSRERATARSCTQTASRERSTGPTCTQKNSRHLLVHRNRVPANVVTCPVLRLSDHLHLHPNVASQRIPALQRAANGPFSPIPHCVLAIVGDSLPRVPIPTHLLSHRSNYQYPMTDP